MIHNAELDAIIVSTPNDTHYPISMLAMDAGLHVLCEKPLARTYARSLEMAKAAQEKGLINLVPFTYSYMPTARYLKELIADGYIGRPYHLNMRYYTGYGREGEYNWRFDLGKAGAGIVGDLGSHFMYIADWLFGSIRAVSCTLGFQVERPGIDNEGKRYTVADDSAIITLDFENGAQGVIHVTAVCYEDTSFGQTHHMEFHGSQGTLYSFTDWDTIQQVKGARVGEGPLRELPIPDDIWGDARRDTVHNTYRDLFRKQNFMTRQFLTAILLKDKVRPDFSDGARIQRLISAAQKSHAEGRRVDVEEITE
jgi:predicted dehydrogenase